MIKIYIQKSEGQLSEAAHALLNSILAEAYGISKADFRSGELGKPYLQNGPYIGISHSRGYLAVGTGDVPFGLDLESTDRKVKAELAARVFSEGELSWYRQRGSTKGDFLTLWTLKESYYKYLGIGLPGFPNSTAFYYDQGWKLGNSECIFKTQTTEKFRIAVCSYTEQSVSFIYL